MQPSVVRRCLASANQTISEVDFFIWHQANKNLIEFMMHRLDIPLEKTIINVDRLGNTADASMGIVLDQAIDEDRISRGDLVLLSGVGAGFIAGASLMRY
jgi:3-oxoacyl-[acyl-carrier-protein] synthase-3